MMMTVHVAAFYPGSDLDFGLGDEWDQFNISMYHSSPMLDRYGHLNLVQLTHIYHTCVHMHVLTQRLLYQGTEIVSGPST